MPLPVTSHRTACVVHGYHRPPVTEPDVHHIWPTAAGGPDTADNRIVVCPTGHRNIHEALRAMLAGREVPKVTRREHRLAVQGYAAIVEGLR